MILINQVKNISEGEADELYRRLQRPHKLIFALGIETGLRISDMLRIKNKDIANPLRVYIGRTKRVGEYKISEWLLEELQSYYTGTLDSYMFRIRGKRAMSRTTYHRHIKRAIEGLGIECSAHSTRKYYLATASLKQCNSTDIKTKY